MQKPWCKAGSEQNGWLLKPLSSNSFWGSIHLNLLLLHFHQLLQFLLFSQNYAKLDFIKLFLNSLELPIYKKWSTLRIALLSKYLYVACCYSGAIKARGDLTDYELWPAIVSPILGLVAQCSSFHWKLILLKLCQLEGTKHEKYLVWSSTTSDREITLA